MRPRQASLVIVSQLIQHGALVARSELRQICSNDQLWSVVFVSNNSTFATDVSRAATSTPARFESPPALL